jgi:hypothetical protein
LPLIPPPVETFRRFPCASPTGTPGSRPHESPHGTGTSREACRRSSLSVDQIGGQLRQAIRIVVRPANVDCQVLAFEVAHIFEPLAKCCEVLGGGRSNLQQSDYRRWTLLRPHRQRPRHRTAEPCDELPSPHRSSSRPLHWQPIPARGAGERATSWLAADLAMEPRGRLLRCMSPFVAHCRPARAPRYVGNWRKQTYGSSRGRRPTGHAVGPAQHPAGDTARSGAPVA